MKPFVPFLLLLPLLAPQVLAGTYFLSDSYQGANFFDMFQFFTDADPTNGRVHVYSPCTLPIDADPSLPKVTMFRWKLL